MMRWKVPVRVAGILVVAVAMLQPACGPGGSNVPFGQHDSGTGEGGGGNDDSGPLPHDLTTIIVEPTNTILEVDLNTPTSQAYTAKGRYTDGTEDDITSTVTWSATNAALGDFNGATFEVPGIASVGAWTTGIEARKGTLKGVAQLTVVAYRMSGAQTDFFFKLPYQDPNGNQNKPLDFHTDVRNLDVFFDMDVTGSMAGEIANLQSTITNTIAPTIRSQIPNTWIGVGAFADFPVSPYGSTNAATGCGRGGLPQPDQPFKLILAISDNLTSVQTAVGQLSNGANPIWCGSDTPESMIESLYQVATGDGLTSPSPTNVPPSHVGVGGVQYRSGTMPVVVPITDAISHAPGESGTCPDTGESVNYAQPVAGVAHTRQQTKDALGAICAKVVGVAAMPSGISAGCTGLADEEDFAKTTGARVPPEVWDATRAALGCAAAMCCTGIQGVGRAPDADGLCPLVFQVDSSGSGLGTSIVTGLQMLTRYAKFDVKTEIDGNPQGDNGEPIPSPYTTADFIKMVQPSTSTAPTPPPTLPAPVIVGAEFHDVYPGSVVTFLVYAYNDFLPQTDQAQFFRATIKVLAGGCTDLDEREVLILVPPKDIVLG